MIDNLLHSPHGTIICDLCLARDNIIINQHTSFLILKESC